MNSLLEKIAEIKLVPVIKLNDAENAVPLAKALEEGGLPVAEITFRTDAAEQSIKNVAAACPGVLLGAGTITNVEQAKKARDAGAAFVISPGFSRDVTEFCVKESIPIFPGACTPTEIMALMEYGIDVAKFFPAEQYGGLATIKALSAPFPKMRFMPTGGISENNLADYLSFPKVIACGGSWMVKESLINAGDFEGISKLVAQAVSLVKGL